MAVYEKALASLRTKLIGMSDLLAQALIPTVTRVQIAKLQESLRDIEVDESLFARIVAEYGSVEPLALAAILEGYEIDIAWVAPGFPYLGDPTAMIRLVAHSVGEKVEALLNEVEHGRMPWEREALALYLCTKLQPDTEQKTRMVRLLRTLSRKHLSAVAAVIVGLAARDLDDDYLNQVAGPLLGLADSQAGLRLGKGFSEIYEGDLLENVPVSEAKVVSGFTVRRSAEKIGRNDPCPCGSRKKYKKCCLKADQARTSDPSLFPGVTMSEVRENPEEHLDAEQLRSLPVRELVKLDFPKLDTRTLLMLVNDFSTYKMWGPAVEALDECMGRPGTDEGHREDLVDSLLESGESDLAERQMDLLENPPEDQVFRLGLLRDSVSLAEVEERALRGLRESENPIPLIDFAHALLAHSPAIGILVARAVLSPESHLDSITLLDLVEEARDRLDLPPEDIGAEIFDCLFDAKLDEAQERALDEGMADLAEETRKLRRELAQAAGERRELKKQLARYEKQLQKTAKPDEQARDDAEAERLRLKVRELKGLVQEGNKKRQELRDEIKGLSLTPEPVKEQTDIAQDEDSSEYDREADTWPLLLPVFTSKAEKSLREDPALGRRAITRIGELCSGSSALRSQVKKMKARPDLRSIRVGRSHRLLVRPQTCEGRLEVVDFVNRRDLESALR